MRGHHRHDIAGHLFLVGLPCGKPGGGVLKALDGGVHVGVTVAPIELKLGDSAPEAHAVRAALDAHLVPQEVVAQRARRHLPSADLAFVKRGRALSLAHEAHVGGNDEGLVLDGRHGWHQLVCRDLGTLLEAQRAASSPECRAVFGRAGEAYGDLVSREDALGKRVQFCRQLRRTLVPRGEQIFEETVIVNAAYLARDLCRSGEVRGEALDGGRMAGVGEAHLKAQTTLLEDVMDAVEVIKVGGAPDLGWQGGQGSNVFADGRGAHHELRQRGERVVVLANDAHEEVQEAQLALHRGVELCGGVTLGVELSQKVAEQACVGELVKGNAAQVKVVIHVVDAMRVQFVGKAGERCVNHLQALLNGCLADVINGQARQRGEGLRGVGTLLLLA